MEKKKKETSSERSRDWDWVVSLLVLQEVLMDADAIMDVGYMDAYGLEALARLVSALLLFRDEGENDKNEESAPGSSHTIQDRVLSAMLFLTFLSSLVLLYLFPIPD